MPDRSRSARIGEEFCRATSTDHVDVVLIFEEETQGTIDHFGVKFLCRQVGQGSRPVQRLCDARDLVELFTPEPLHEVDHLRRELGSDLRSLVANDSKLLVSRGVVDPVVEAAALLVRRKRLN